jgi:ATP-binding cassette subfamily B protein
VTLRERGGGLEGDGTVAEAYLTPSRRSRFGMVADLLWMATWVALAWPWLVLAAGGIAVLRGLLVPVQLWLTKLLVNSIAAGLGGAAASSAANRWETWIGLLTASVLLDRVAAGVQGWLERNSDERIGPWTQERVMAQAAKLPLVAFEHEAYYDRLRRLLPDAGSKVPRLVGQVLQVAQGVPSFLGYAVSLALVSPVLAAVVLAATIPTVVAWTVLGQAAWGVTVAVTRDRRLSEYYSGLLTDRTCAKEVRLYGLANYLLGRWSEHYWRAVRQQRRQYVRSGNLLRAATTGSLAVSMLALWLVVRHVVPSATAGTFTLLFLAVEGLFGSTFAMGNSLHALGEQSGYASELRSFLGNKSATRRPGARAARTRALARMHTASAVRPLTRRTVRDRGGHEHTAGATQGLAPDRRMPFPSPIRDGIRFEDVWFSYPGSAAAALAGINLEIHAGEKVALVGANGAGKTTLTKLLLGLYKPDAGRITVDGVDMARIDPTAYRAAVSAVFQHFVRYQLTFRENVGLGDPPAIADANRLVYAVELSGANEVLALLGGDPETLLGPDVGGTDLSGGQWQRVALARAFFRAQPRGHESTPPEQWAPGAQILVLDEPTAALDPLAELAVFERFAELAAGRTALLVSHRLGMARLADRVVVLRDGRVVESAPHDELYRAGGEYAAMFDAQARWYR